MRGAQRCERSYDSVPPAVLGEHTPQGTLSGRKRAQFSWIANLIWGIADDVLRDLYLYLPGKYRDVTLTMARTRFT